MRYQPRDETGRFINYRVRSQAMHHRTHAITRQARSQARITYAIGWGCILGAALVLAFVA